MMWRITSLTDSMVRSDAGEGFAAAAGAALDGAAGLGAGAWAQAKPPAVAAASPAARIVPRRIVRASPLICRQLSGRGETKNPSGCMPEGLRTGRAPAA